MNYELVNFCEFDKYAVQSYCAIHGQPESKNLGDITKVDETKLPDFTMICGGSPCQDFSVAGKRKGAAWKCTDCGHEYNPLTVHWSKRDYCPKCQSKNLDKTRSSLLVEWLRIVRAKKPNFGLYENVKNIVGKEFLHTTFQLFINELQEYGYNTYWKVLNAKDYGIPQNRERCFVFLVKQSLDNGMFHFPDALPIERSIKNILENEVNEKYFLTEQMLERLTEHKRKQKEKGNGFGMNIKTEDEISDNLLARDYKDPKCVYVKSCEIKQIGQMYPNSGNPQAGRIYDADGISPSLDTCSGGNRMPKIINFGKLNEHQSGKVISPHGISGTLTTLQGQVKISEPIIFASRGRNPDNPSDCRTGSPTVQRMELKTDGCSNTITSVQKDNFVLLPPVVKDGIHTEVKQKARKLTPKECFRLMAFDDLSFLSAMCGSSETAKTLLNTYPNNGIEIMNAAERIQEVSNTQLYKQAGNSIVVDVLYYIYLEIYHTMPYLFDNLKLSSFFSGIGAFEKALDKLYEYINEENSHQKEGGEA